MTQVAMTSTPTKPPARRYGLWAIIGTVLTLASLGAIGWAWRNWVAGTSANDLAGQRKFLWLAVALGSLAAAASGLAIAALNAREESGCRWLGKIICRIMKRLLLALQIIASFVAAGAAAALVFEFKLPR